VPRHERPRARCVARGKRCARSEEQGLLVVGREGERLVVELRGDGRIARLPCEERRESKPRRIGRSPRRLAREERGLAHKRLPLGLGKFGGVELGAREERAGRELREPRLAPFGRDGREQLAHEELRLAGASRLDQALDRVGGVLDLAKARLARRAVGRRGARLVSTAADEERAHESERRPRGRRA
jgi:hypothetical protein